MNSKRSPSAIKPSIAHVENPSLLGSSGLGGTGGSTCSTATPSSEVTLGVRETLFSKRLKEPVNCLRKLFPRTRETPAELS